MHCLAIIPFIHACFSSDEKNKEMNNVGFCLSVVFFFVVELNNRFFFTMP